MHCIAHRHPKLSMYQWIWAQLFTGRRTLSNRQIAFQLTGVKKTYCATYRIEIFPVNCVMHPSNNQSLHCYDATRIVSAQWLRLNQKAVRDLTPKMLSSTQSCGFWVDFQRSRKFSFLPFFPEKALSILSWEKIQEGMSSVSQFNFFLCRNLYISTVI